MSPWERGCDLPITSSPVICHFVTSIPMRCQIDHSFLRIITMSHVITQNCTSVALCSKGILHPPKKCPQNLTCHSARHLMPGCFAVKCVKVLQVEHLVVNCSSSVVLKSQSLKPCAVKSRRIDAYIIYIIICIDYATYEPSYHHDTNHSRKMNCHGFGMTWVSSDFCHIFAVCTGVLPACVTFVLHHKLYLHLYIYMHMFTYAFTYTEYI